MADLIRIIKSKVTFLKEFDLQKRKAEEQRPKENASVIKIQRLFRGTRIRIDVKYKSDAATEVERVFRGHLGRIRARNALQDRTEARQICLFQYFAIQMQRSFRGYYSRKYKRNHASRKAYVRTVIDKNNQVLAMMESYANEQAQRDAEDAQAEKVRAFKSYAENLHHLVSTQVTPGVFNPRPEVMEVPRLNDIPVEEHIRCVVRDLLRTKGITKNGLVRDLHGSRKIPYVGLKNRLSLQASAPYDSAAREDKSRSKMLHRILVSDKESFLAGGLPKSREIFPPLHAHGEPFMDAFANPLLVRGVPESTQEMRNSTLVQKPLFVRQLDRPFFTRSGGNKSAVLPNDLFEVIAEAEETGGTAQRNLGVSTRFGISDSCDNRLPGSTIPVPPPRVSSTMRTKRIVMMQNTPHLKTTISREANIQDNMATEQDSSGDEQ